MLWPANARMQTERRGPNRPHPGELRTCPTCRQIMVFEERYVVQGDRVVESNPAWVCQNANCHRIDPVRRQKH
jgi:hypothetical protein